MGEQGNTQHLKDTYRKTGSPIGVMPVEDAAVAFTRKWQNVRQNIPIEDRQEIEPLLEMLLGKAAYSSPESARAFSNVVGGGSNS